MSTTISLYCANKAPATQKTYLQVWHEWIEHCPDPLTATAKHAAAYLSGLNCADNTRRKKLNILRTLYGVLLDMGEAPANIFAQVARFLSARKAQQVRPTQRLSARDVRRLLKVKAGRPWNTVRDRAIFAIMFGCGLRRSEVVRLNCDDVRVSVEGCRYLRLVDTKAGIEQEQPVPIWVWRHLSKLITERAGQGAKDGDPLFCSFGNLHHRMTTSALWKLWKLYAKRLELDPRVSCHAARATFATALLEAGAASDEVQRALRHKSPGMVSAYDKRRKALADNIAWRIRF